MTVTTKTTTRETWTNKHE